jgi:hypothetical protein
MTASIAIRANQSCFSLTRLLDITQRNADRLVIVEDSAIRVRPLLGAM